MASNQRRGKGFFRNLMRGSSSRPTLLRGDPHERSVTGSASRARQEQVARPSEAQRSSTLHQVHTRFDDQTSLQSSLGGSSDDDTEDLGCVGEPVDWTLVRRHAGKFTHAAPSSAGASDLAEDSHGDNARPRGSRRPQSGEKDWMITSPQPGGPTDARLIPSYGGHIVRVIYEGSERTPPIRMRSFGVQ